ncbi:MAG: hypothetical protein JRD89_15640 [Deltaproteobacteria bacterium]|nr:hypothetical protein [Deltaproteobacteria bacterium]
MPAIHEQELRKIWQSGGAGREALREELVRYRWWFGTDEKSRVLGQFPVGGRFQGHPQFVLEVESERVVVSDWDFGVYEIDKKTLEKVWFIKADPIARRITVDGVDYGYAVYVSHDPARPNYVLVGCQKGIFEVDRNTGEIVRKMVSYELGPFIKTFWGYKPWYDSKEPESYLWINDPSRHVVCKLDWTGKILWQFGEAGVSGSDTAHLNVPTSVTELRGGVFIADMANNRVLTVDEGTKNVSFIVPYFEPTHLSLHRRLVWLGVGSIKGRSRSFPIILSGGGTFVTYIDVDADCVTVGDDLDLYFTANHMCHVVSYKFYKPDITFPWVGAIEESVNPGAETPIIPIYCFGRPVTFYGLNTESGKLRIYVPNLIGPGRGLVTDPNTPWLLYDEVTLTANTLEPYTPTARNIVFGVSIINDGAEASTAKVLWCVGV